MWSISLNRPFGSLSARRITLFVTALLMACFVTISSMAAGVSAQTTPSDDTLTYNGDTYSRLTPIPNSDPTYYSSACGLLDTAYVHVADDGGAHVVCSDNFSSSPIRFVWFPNATASDGQVSSFGEITEQEKTAIIAIQNRYELEGLPTTPEDAGEPKNPEIEIPSSIQNNRTAYISLRDKFNANVRDQKSISINDIESDGPIGNSTTGQSITTCDSEHTHGLGWVICPVTNWLADTMDLLYKAISSFLIVSPLSTSRDNVMYYIWDVMRNIANILFIFGFLIIIYSQITNLGISNYGLKRLLPRLILAAVLVNVSYWISTLAIDLSNLLGVSLKDSIDVVREGIPREAGRDLSEWSWTGIAGVILSGGAASFAGISIGATALATAGGSLWFLLVGLAGVILSGLVAILVLAARQALITILVIISPLAFVAYLLPSTEKYFDRWKDLFMTMLLVFPIFSIIFGASQLAGLAIIEGADPNSMSYFNVVILGMIVQVAPVIITPMLIKLSGSLLGRFAGMVNNPNKGIVDQTRKFAQTRSDNRKKRQIGETDKDGKFRHNNPLALAARWNSNREIDQARRTKAYETGIEAAYESSGRAHDTHMQSTVNSMLKDVAENRAKRDIAREIATHDAYKIIDAMSRLSKDEAANAENINKTFYEAMQARPGVVGAAIRNIGGDEASVKLMEDIANQAQDTAYAAKREANRQSSISGAISDAYHGQMLNNTAWQEYAGASDDAIDQFGAMRIKTAAQSEMIAASAKRVENYGKQFGFENTDPNIIRQKASGALPVADEEEQRAAIIYVGKSGDSASVIRLTEELDLTKASESIRQEFADAIKNSSAKPIYMTNGKLGYDIPQGHDPNYNPLPTPDNLAHEWMIDATIKHKYDTSALATKASKDEVIRLNQALNIKGGKNRLTAKALADLKDDIRNIFQDEEMYRQLGDKKQYIIELGTGLGINSRDFTPPPPSKTP